MTTVAQSKRRAAGGPQEHRSGLRAVFGSDLRSYTMIIALVILLIVFQISTLLLGIIGIVVVIVAQLRSRARQIAITGAGTPLWALITRVVIICAVIAYLTYLFGSGRVGTSFPIVGLIVGALIIIYHIVTERTPFGRHIYAVGGNRAAAALSGVNVARTYFFAMVNMSFLAAVAGILFTGRSTSAGPDLGTGWELDAIAAVFIGGAAVSGGIGTVIGTVVGAFVMAVLNNGLMALGVSSDRTSVIKGLVLLAAVALDVYNKMQGRASIIGRLLGGVTTPKPDEAAPPGVQASTAGPVAQPPAPTLSSDDTAFAPVHPDTAQASGYPPQERKK